MRLAVGKAVVLRRVQWDEWVEWEAWPDRCEGWRETLPVLAIASARQGVTHLSCCEACAQRHPPCVLLLHATGSMNDD